MFTIRPAAAADIPALARIHVQGWRDAYGGAVDQDWLGRLDEDAQAAQWREWFDPAQRPVLLSGGNVDLGWAASAWRARP